MVFAIRCRALIAVVFSVLLFRPAAAAPLILNEYNAVDSTNLLGNNASDPFWGQRPGNGDDWFELVVITDHLNMQGWEFIVVNEVGSPTLQESFSIQLTNHLLWSDLRSGTIVTISEELRDNVGDYNPAVGKWWLNIQAVGGGDNTYAIVTCIAPACAPGMANWKVSNNNTQVTIRNHLDQVVFGPAGEGVTPASGVGGTEVLKLEANPTAATTPNSPYADGNSSTFGHPNAWNSGASLQDFSALRSSLPYAPLTTVVINEVLTHSDPGIDWVELYNTTGAPVDISRWYISDSFNVLTEYQIPMGTVVPAHGFIVFDQNSLGFGFSSACGDAVILSAADAQGNLTGLRDYFEIGPIENGVTIGRFPDGTGNEHRLAAASIAAPNLVYRVGPLVINEIMYHPPTQPMGMVDPEFIELYNPSGSAVMLSTDFGGTGVYSWRITGGVSFTFPVGLSIPAGGYLLVVGFDPATDLVSLSQFRTYYGLGPSVPIVGPYTGKLSNFSDSVRLRKPDSPEMTPCSPGDPVPFAPMVTIDEVTYFDFGAWPSTADGLGASLERINPQVISENPGDWAASLVMGGSPGEENTVLEEPVPLLSQWAVVCMGGLLLIAATLVLADRPIRHNVS